MTSADGRFPPRGQCPSRWHRPTPARAAAAGALGLLVAMSAALDSRVPSGAAALATRVAAASAASAATSSVAAITAPGAAAAPAAPLAQQSDRPREPDSGGLVDLASADPQVALQRIKPAAGYEVNLFASEKEFPVLAKPLAMTFDARGRLWVLTSPTYPHYVPGQPPDDKLIILDDTNQDGRADKVTVFADHLYLPTGFELGDGGVYVSQQPNLMFLRDTDGDDKADERRIILHGFGTEDSHHAIHAFTWGPEGGLYFQEGTFLHSQVETPYGPVRVEEGAVWRYEPRTERLSVFVSHPFANPWGHVVDRWGQNFVSDASNGYNHFGTAFSGHVNYPTKQRPLKEWTLTRVRPTSGIEFVRSRHFPDEAQGNFLYNNVIGFQGIKQYRVQDEGSGFVGVEVEPLLQSSDLNFRPVGLQFGADGALYVIDWFNPLIGHMQYSMRDARRDKGHGRVWRVTAKGRPLLERPRIAGASIAEQLELLKAYEDRTRYRARRALREQPTSAVLPALQAWIAALDKSSAEYEHQLLEALWLYQQHDSVQPALLHQLLAAKDFRARAAAVRAVQLWFDRLDDGMALLTKAVRDPAPRVRLEAVRAFSFVPTVASAEAALDVLAQPTDYYLQYVLDSTLTTLEPVWKAELSAGRPVSAARPAGLTLLLDRLSIEDLIALPPGAAVQQARLRRAGVDPAHRQAALNALARANGTQPAAELIAAIARLDGTPGGDAALGDLARMLARMDASSLTAVRGDVAKLAAEGRSEPARQAGFAALLRADHSVDPAWTMASASPRRQIDLLGAIPLLDDPALLDALYTRIAPIVSASAASAPAAASGSAGAAPVPGTAPVQQTMQAPPVEGRYVRIVRPGQARMLALVEVQVFSRGENIAPSAKATQSSLVADGSIGGRPERAIDGKLDPDFQAGALAFTAEEQDPWWELDLGATRPIDIIALWNPSNAAAGPRARTDELHVSVLNEARQPVYATSEARPTEPTQTLTLGGDFSARVTNAAMRALSAIPGRAADAVAVLAGALDGGASRAAALAAIRRVPIEKWPAAQLSPIAERTLAYATALPPTSRSGPVFADALALGREASSRLPAEADRARFKTAFDQVAVRTIRIEAVLGAMKFDVTHFSVVSGEEVEIEFVNQDHMPHNLLITAPDAMEMVSLKAEAMMQQPDAFAKHFVPPMPEVLFATPLINHGETARLRFTAPKRRAGYPFVCTFPGHWRTMNGTMQVVAANPSPTDKRER